MLALGWELSWATWILHVDSPAWILHVDSPAWILHVVWASLSIMVPGEPGRNCKTKSKNVASTTFY